MPDREWLIQPMGGGEVSSLTFAQGMNEARKMASHLASLNLPPKSHIAILSKNTAHWILSDLAIWMAGHVSIPIYPTLTAQSVRQILDHSGAKLIFIGKLDGWAAMKEGVPEGMQKILLPLSAETNGPTWQSLIKDQKPIAGDVQRDADDIATIIYTSGTTGTPKGAMHTFERIGIAGAGLVKTLRMTTEDRVLSYLPLSHVIERWLVETCGLQSGGRIYFAESLDTFVKDLQRARPTLFVSVPRLWVKFQQGVHAKMPAKKLSRMLSIPILSSIVKKKVLKNLGLDHVRFAGTGSAPLPAEIVAWYRRLGLDLLEAYGMTENFAFSHLSQPGRVRVGYVGETHEGVEHRISPEGEVQVKSPATMTGYYNNPEGTQEMMTDDGYLKTGDRGEVDNMGRLRITGRVKELFKSSKGKYVAPSPIENKLINHERLEQAVVTGVGQPQPCALVVLSEETRKKLDQGSLGATQIESELTEHVSAVNRDLDPHEQLDFVVVVKEPWLIENGFLTPTMKVKRAMVEQTFGARLPDWYATHAKKSVVWEQQP